jgi:hypothetical protein
MRTELCICGGLIVAPSLAESAPYVEAHGFLPGHQAWRARKEGWHVAPRRERPTDPLPVSRVTGSVRALAPAPVVASAAAVEGRR